MLCNLVSLMYSRASISHFKSIYNRHETIMCEGDIPRMSPMGGKIANFLNFIISFLSIFCKFILIRVRYDGQETSIDIMLKFSPWSVG